MKAVFRVKDVSALRVNPDGLPLFTGKTGELKKPEVFLRIINYGNFFIGEDGESAEEKIDDLFGLQGYRQNGGEMPGHSLPAIIPVLSWIINK
jgi:hypothetical protein